MDKFILKADNRKIIGRKVNSLRREGILPANIYGKKVKSQSIQVDLNEFKKIYAKAGETNLVEIQINSDKKPVLIHNIQADPVTDKPLHVDFLQVDLKEKVTAEVPIELVGEAPAEKQGLGTVVLYIDKIEVEALPSDLPDKFEIDAAALTEVDKAVLVKDLKVDVSKVELKADPEQILVKVEPPRKEEEVAPPVVAEGEAAEEVGTEAVKEESSKETQKEEEVKTE
ncbi:MAG: 50S ribosomal protein L25 [Candidatus Woesebacteria bacterium GW2011_GWB1_38_8]|uniref:Large ribosomal subunit protein bL25 n=1 Tax=Candidatus Woesebacteria bacterium GW2011_GWB1_38_8 TaxID=1618570 RepID=A0A0G0LCI6_9BACT|nr:MAG: 50S ribosomal protein L25 [Candidatus Woesebacteria bacterium GW2011_GWB1_38_8]